MATIGRVANDTLASPKKPSDPPPLSTSETSSIAGTQRTFSLPPEVLIQVISAISPPSIGPSSIEEFDHAAAHTARNAQLAPLARVDRRWQEAVYSVLYGSLELTWIASKVSRLRESIQRNPALLQLVRRLEVTAVGFSEWRDAFVAATMSRDYGAQSHPLIIQADARGIDEAQAASMRMWAAGDSLPGAVEEMWEAQLCDEAIQVWEKAGNGIWVSLHGASSLGAGELLDLLDVAPNVQSLVVRGFASSAVDRIATRGTYPSITSLETPKQYPYSSHPPSLASLLAQRTPNLKRLSGRLDDNTSQLDLPPLTHLTIDHGFMSQDDSPLVGLLQRQPTLRSLRITPRRGRLWATALAPFLANLDSFTLTTSLQTPPTFPAEFDVLVEALAASTAIRHLSLDVPYDKWLPVDPMSEWSILDGIHQLLERRKERDAPPIRVELALGRGWTGNRGGEVMQEDKLEALGDLARSLEVAFEVTRILDAP